MHSNQEMHYIGQVKRPQNSVNKDYIQSGNTYI